MAYNPGVLEASLAAAVGDEPSLIRELRGAFLASANAHVCALREAKSIHDWRVAAVRLHGVAASFGVLRLMDAAMQAAQADRIDAAVVRKIERTITALDL